MIWIALLVLALHAPSAEIRIWQTPIETGNRNSGEKILHTTFRYLDRSIALIVFNQDSGDRSVPDSLRQQCLYLNHSESQHHHRDMDR